jgi:DNA-directed RNA polymerase subunit RPC12/RpoP
MATRDRSEGLTCPNCGGIVPVAEGARTVQCPFCGMRSLVHGDSGVQRWQVTANIARDRAQEAVHGFLGGFNRAIGLRRQARIRELFLVYLPYWRVHALVLGWLLGRVKSGDDETKPVEVKVSQEMDWNDAATDVSEFGVHRVPLEGQGLLPYNEDHLHLQGMVFEPAESPTAAEEEARSYFTYRAQSTKSLTQKYFEKFHILRPRLSLVYYPLWVGRYEFRQRNYQVVVDGVSGKVLYGKAPGNIFFRAAMLVGGMALGNLLLVNGTILALLLLSDSSDDDSAMLLCLPAVIGLAIILAGYRAFRYGEEVEQRAKAARKAAPPEKGGGSLDMLQDIAKELRKMR